MLKNTAPTELNLEKNIKERWSPRAFLEDQIDDNALLRIFESARWAASSYNEQPWRFIIGIKDQGNTYANIIETLVPFNQQWASKAPVVILACGKKTFSRNGKPNPHMSYDVGQAMATLTLQATEEGLHVHQMAGFSSEKASQIFNIPEEFEPIVVAAIGKVDEEEILKKDGPKERTRKRLEEICWNSWNSPLKTMNNYELSDK
ncbi:MAG: nitroreductase family protein [Cyclobacteriaceae bacterium]